MTVVASRNYEVAAGQNIIADVTLYAIRVISHYVTFYRATYTPAYFDEIALGLPLTAHAQVNRNPELNGLRNGYDLTNATERAIVFRCIDLLLSFIMKGMMRITDSFALGRS